MPDNIFTLVCEKCKGGHYEDKIILCDRCDKGWHMFCLAPAVEKVPEGEWVCPSCIAAGGRRFGGVWGRGCHESCHESG